MNLFSRLADYVFRRSTTPPTESAGTSATQIVGGYVVSRERNQALAGVNRFTSYENVIANCTVAGMSVWITLDLVGSVEWKVVPPKDSGARGEELADLTRDRLVNGMESTWRDAVCLLAEGEFFGYSIGEWIMRPPGDDGVIGMLGIERRAQSTIEQWDVDERGQVQGVNQRSPHTGETLYIERGKLAYYRDGKLTDSPEGFGVMRLIFKAADELMGLEKLEQFGFSGDLRGTPYARMPMSAMRAGKMKTEEIVAAEAPTRAFVRDYASMQGRGLVHDSSVWRGEGPEKTPSQTPLWSVEILKGGATALPDVHVAIERKVREIARVCGTEAFLLGSDSKGSHALADSKTTVMAARVDGILAKVRRVMERDVLRPWWDANGFPPELIPTLEPDSVNLQDVEASARILETLSKAGSPLDPTDRVVDEIRKRAKMSERPAELIDKIAEDAMLRAQVEIDVQRAKARGPGDAPDDGGEDDGDVKTREELNKGAAAAQRERRFVRKADGWYVLSPDGTRTVSGPHILKSHARDTLRGEE